MNKFLKALSVSAVAILTISFQTVAQTIDEGLKHLDAEQYAASGKIFKQLVQTAPTAENYFYLGYYYLNLPEIKTDSAKMAFEKGASFDQKRPDALCRVGLGAVKLAMKDRAGAKADFDAVTKDTKSKNPEVLFRIGEAYTLFETNDPAEAVRNIDLALEKKKDNYNYYVAKGDAYMIKNDGGPAMTNYETAAGMKKDLAKIYARMGKLWLQGKNYPKALKYYQDAIAADANYAPTYRQLGDFYVIYGNYEKAAENYKKFLDLSDSDDAAKLRYVKLAFASKDYTNATKVLNEIKGRIKDPIKYRLQGMSDFETGKPELAIPEMNDFLNVAGKDRIMGQDYGYIGRSYAALTEADKDKKKANDSLAIMNMQKAIDMNDTLYNYTADMAKIFATNKNFKKAAELYRTQIAKSSKPNIADYTVLGQYLYQDARITKDTNTYAESEKVWTKAAEVYKEKYPIASYYVGNSRRNIEGSIPTGKAIPAMENFVKYAWADKEKGKNKTMLIDACNYVASVSLLLKDTTKATDYYKKTLELDPSNADATNGLNSLGAAAPTTIIPPK